MSSYTGLLLCGGESRRMAIDKAMIGMLTTAPSDIDHSTNKPLFLHLLEGYFASEYIGSTIICARDSAQAGLIHDALGRAGGDARNNIIIIDDVDTFGRIGPATGILSAHAKYPNQTFCVLAVDFPQTESAALAELVRGHEAMRDSPVTCFMHVNDGHPEPLMSIWQPAALRRLRDNAKLGKSGPCYTAKQLWKERDPLKGMVLGHGLVEPSRPVWVQDTDTPEEWRKVFGMLPAAV